LVTLTLSQLLTKVAAEAMIAAAMVTLAEEEEEEVTF
jgi:hypothetical protein